MQTNPFDFSLFHLGQPLWLWALFALPFVWTLYFIFYRKITHETKLERYIDKKLLPHLLLTKKSDRFSLYKILLLWSSIVLLVILSLTNPIWSFRQVKSYKAGQTLVILLDLSRSMDLNDVKPSRLSLAKQKIQDLVEQAKGVNIALIAFAADPYMIAPPTTDKRTLLHLLSPLSTDLIPRQGSQLKPALQMAEQLIANAGSESNALLLISDGGFADSSALSQASALKQKGIKVYTMGVGSTDGIALRDEKGQLIKRHDEVVVSSLEEEKLKELSRLGGGGYFAASSLGDKEKSILNDLAKTAKKEEDKVHLAKIWEERFYLLLLPALPLMLLLFRRGQFLTVCSLLLLCPSLLKGDEGQVDGEKLDRVNSLFLNSQQRAAKAFEEHDYSKAAELFKDPYQQGVSYYRMGDYKKAEEAFAQAAKEGSVEEQNRAQYNLANALAYQEKYKEAISTLEGLLKKEPENRKAQENIELLKKILEEQKNKKKEEKKNKKDKQKEHQTEKQQAEQQRNSSEEQKSQQQEANQKEQTEKDKAGQKPNGESKQEDEEGEEEKSQLDNQSELEEKQRGKEEEGKEEEDIEESENRNQGEQSEQEQHEEQEVDGLENEEQENEKTTAPSQKDLDADQWLNRIEGEPKQFLRNKFTLESKRNGQKEVLDPW